MKTAREMVLTADEVAAIRKHKGKRPSKYFIAAKVRSIRERIGVSQSEFAELMRVPTDTIQNWEQARRTPRGAALTLLLLVDRDPNIIKDKLPVLA